jgi:hypothetical protein
MRNWARNLTAFSAVLGLIGAWCVGYSVIDKFEAREYGDVGFGGNAIRTPEYFSWSNRNDLRIGWGLAFITVGLDPQNFPGLFRLVFGDHGYQRLGECRFIGDALRVASFLRGVYARRRVTEHNVFGRCSAARVNECVVS